MLSRLRNYQRGHRLARAGPHPYHLCGRLVWRVVRGVAPPPTQLPGLPCASPSLSSSRSETVEPHPSGARISAILFRSLLFHCPQTYSRPFHGCHFDGNHRWAHRSRHAISRPHFRTRAARCPDQEGTPSVGRVDQAPWSHALALRTLRERMEWRLRGRHTHG